MADESIAADVLIAGGGIQGVTLLHELTAAGLRSVLLASAGDLGSGETLHSHGYMHCGVAMSAAGISAASLVGELQEAAAWWRDRIRPPYAPGPPVYCALPAAAEVERRRHWESLKLGHERVYGTPVALRGGDADRDDVRLFSIDDRLVSMRDLLEALAAPLQGRIVRACVTGLELDDEGRRVARCRLASQRGQFAVRPRVALLACGREAQPLLRAARTPSGRTPLESRCADLNRIRFVPMLLVRGSRLPRISGIFETHALSLLTHPVEGDEAMWILTPTAGHPIERGDFDPSRERIRGGAFVRNAASRLWALVPEARRRRDADLRFGFYFGGKIDHPDGGNRRYLDDCGLTNLRLVWPGVWSLSLTNAREIAKELRSSREFADLFDPARAPLDRAAQELATGAVVAEELRLGPSLTWHRWAEFEALQCHS